MAACSRIVERLLKSRGGGRAASRYKTNYISNSRANENYRLFRKMQFYIDSKKLTEYFTEHN